MRINRDTPPPGLRRALWRNLILAAVALALVAIVLYLRREQAVPVEVFTVTLNGGGGAAGAASASVTANGYVVARTRAAVSAKLAGRLAELRVSEGSQVRAGEVIARLENDEYAAQVSQAEANLATARAELIEATARRDQLTREARRVTDIRQENPDLVAEEQVEAARSAADQAVARVDAAAARVQAAEAERRFAEATLESTLIRAPFTGTVLRKEAEVGEVVAPSVGGGLTRGAVVTMADFATLEVEVDVNEAYIARVTNGQGARITLDAYPDTGFRGRVRQVVPTADRQRATVQVKVAILDRDRRILPEMGARVDFLEPEAPRRDTTAARTPRIRVPAAAVRVLEGQSVVWLVRQGRLVSKVVDAGPVSGGFREVRSGLVGGEQLLTGGVEEPKEGMAVVVAGR
ncbi:MAG: efflux RND transporter periplasmic adaptor subunit [Gemmatimonadota bacterium]|nr:efflux RND transporter periplasmic adaptor subunit [Gemmatimonadota bacterium]